MTQFIPAKEVTVRPNDKPWYDSEIRRLSRHRDRQKAFVIARGPNSDWEKYKVPRNKLKNRIKYVKQRYFSHLNESSCNIRSESPRNIGSIFEIWSVQIKSLNQYLLFVQLKVTRRILLY